MGLCLYMKHFIKKVQAKCLDLKTEHAWESNELFCWLSILIPSVPDISKLKILSILHFTSRLTKWSRRGLSLRSCWPRSANLIRTSSSVTTSPASTSTSSCTEWSRTRLQTGKSYTVYKYSDNPKIGLVRFLNGYNKVCFRLALLFNTFGT